MTSMPRIDKVILSAIKEQWLKFVTGMAQALVIMTLFGLLYLVISNGLNYFWPQTISQVEYRTAQSDEFDQKLHKVFAYSSNDKYLDELQGRVWLHLDTWATARNRTQLLLSPGDVVSENSPEGLARIDFYDGRFMLAKPDSLLLRDEVLALHRLSDLNKQIISLLNDKNALNAGELVNINRAIAQLRLSDSPENAPALVSLNQKFDDIQVQLNTINQSLKQYQMLVKLADSESIKIELQDIRLMSFPNDINLWQKLMVFKDNLVLFLTEDMRNANQAGGVFPAIFGTILMVFLMTIFVSPLGIMAAIYLTEYAPNNSVVSIIRLAVSNLAAVPSVVYGVFGLGFFVYQIGGNIDSLFYSDQLPTPTFGTPGLLWASLTMALLTLPVVIVTTEEGLRRVPEGLRKASYSLGATRYETIRRIVLPVASSSLMTGIILAIARAAGEVAPMLMVGAVKYAPALPVDGEFPFLHLERQFMHLGVLIYDGAFHGQSTQQGAGIMFAACLFLLSVVLLLNFVAITVRARLQSRYGN